MGLFDFFKNKAGDAGIATVSDMISFGLEWREKYLANYAIKNNAGTRIASLMYSCWFVWYHCLGKNKVSRDQSYLNDFFAHLMAHLQDGL